jgi:hypothetical protein
MAYKEGTGGAGYWKILLGRHCARFDPAVSERGALHPVAVAMIPTLLRMGGSIFTSSDGVPERQAVGG